MSKPVTILFIFLTILVGNGFYLYNQQIEMKKYLYAINYEVDINRLIYTTADRCSKADFYDVIASMCVSNQEILQYMDIQVK